MNTLKKVIPVAVAFALFSLVLFAQDALFVHSSGKVGVLVDGEPQSELEVNGRIRDKTGFVMPVGTIMAYGGATAPDGWLLCDGSTIGNGSSGANHADNDLFDLYDVLRSTFGGAYNWASGDAVNLPDLRGIFPRGAGTHGTLSDAKGSAFTSTLGIYQNDGFQGHWHQVKRNNSIGAQTGSDIGTDDRLIPDYVANRSGAEYWKARQYEEDTINLHGIPRNENETRPANLGVTYIIKY